MTRHDTEEQREQHYKNLYEEQVKAIKILTKKVRLQDKELMRLRNRYKVTMNVLKRIKRSLTEPNWKQLTGRQIRDNMQRIHDRIETLEKREE